MPPPAPPVPVRTTRRRLLQAAAAAPLAALLPRRAQGAGPPIDPERFRVFLDQAYAALAEQDPEWQTVLGLKGPALARWSDQSDAPAEHARAALIRARATVERDFPADRLAEKDRLTRRLFLHDSAVRLEELRWRDHRYTLDHLNGRQIRIPELLINFHRIDGLADAEAYVERLRRVPDAVDQLIAATERARQRGIVPPTFSLRAAAAGCRDLLNGAPFHAATPDSALLADIRRKLQAAPDIAPGARDRLLADATAALRDRFAPAYRRLAAYIEELAARVGDHGLWGLPDGENYYRWCLARHTTLPVTAESLHRSGLDAVGALQAQILEAAAKAGIPGELQAVFRSLKEDDRLYYPDSDAGRDAYLADLRTLVARVADRLPTQFRRLPRARLEVRRYEPFQEPFVPMAQYNPGSIDGSRPAAYLVNLRNMREMPRFNMEVLALHESIPGHHLQVALAQELTDLPTFRRVADHTAFAEGWGLYCEGLGKEMGFYQDPHAEIGRLGFALWRAVRLVVDTGIHALRWPREQAVSYFMANASLPEQTVRREIDRYFVLPGQACAYRVGLDKMMELRAAAQRSLGNRFDIREFHDILLGNGAMPLPILDEVVGAWLHSH